MVHRDEAEAVIHIMDALLHVFDKVLQLVHYYDYRNLIGSLASRYSMGIIYFIVYSHYSF